MSIFYVPKIEKWSYILVREVNKTISIQSDLCLFKQFKPSEISLYNSWTKPKI